MEKRKVEFTLWEFRTYCLDQIRLFRLGRQTRAEAVAEIKVAANGFFDAKGYPAWYRSRIREEEKSMIMAMPPNFPGTRIELEG